MLELPVPPNLLNQCLKAVLFLRDNVYMFHHHCARKTVQKSFVHCLRKSVLFCGSTETTVTYVQHTSLATRTKNFRRSNVQNYVHSNSSTTF